MARIGALNILSPGISVEDFNAKLGAQTPNAVAIGEGPNLPLQWVGPGNIGEVLMGTGPGTAPVFGTIAAGTGISISSSPGLITISATSSLGAQTAHAVAVGEGTGNPLNWIGPGNNGEVLTGAGSSADPFFRPIAAGTGITISTLTTGIVITATGASGGFSWTTVAGGAVAMAPNTGYIVTGNTTFTLPASTQGQISEIVGNNATWSITGGGTMNLVTAQTTTLSSTSGYDAITLVCVDAPNTYVATATQGNITVS